MIGTTVGPYRVLAELGSGGMGTVYRAEGPDGVVALKVAHAHLAADERFLARFRREIDVGTSIRHENVVRTIDSGECVLDGRTVPWLAMEFVEGQTLRGLLEELGRVPERLCRHVAKEAAEGLAAIHSAGAVHRDLKPENVLVTREHLAKVMDLGIARVLGERLSTTGSFIGSVRYAAPEQFRDTSRIDARADLWAMGVLLYELLSGTNPFDAEEVHGAIRRILDEEPWRLGEAAPQTSAFLEETVHALLRKDPAQRVQTAAELAEILARGEDSAWWAARSREVRTETHRPLRRMRVPRETAVHGRERELAALRSAWDTAAAGDGRVVLVEGEAGIGKTRLVDEFVGGLEASGADLLFLHGGFPPGGAATASGAIAAAFRDHFAEGDLGAAVRAALPETPLLAPAFEALLRGDATPSGCEPLTRESLPAVFVHALRTLAAARPVVLLVDDLHFAPEGGLALFAALAAAAPGHRVLLVGTTRPGLDERWSASIERLPHASRVVLARLGAADIARLLVEAFESERLAEELAVRIATKSDGNPFFVFEIVRALRERGHVVRGAGGAWEAAGPIHEIEIPSSVRELVDARLAGLDEEDRELLEAAACQGFEFDAALVAEALGIPAYPALKRFARIERSRRLVRAAGRRHVFDHHQVQAALYEGLFPQLREQLHAVTAEAMERRAGGPGADPAAIDGATSLALADQFLLGGRGDRAVRWLNGALTFLQNAFQHDALVALAGRALAVPGLLAGAARARMLLAVSLTLAVAGRDEDERAALEEALALADAAGDPAFRARARNFLGRHLQRTGRTAEAERMLGEALAIATSAGAREEEITIRVALLTGAVEEGRFAEVLAGCDRLLELGRETGSWRAECDARILRASAYMATGRDEDAREILEALVADARREGDVHGELSALGNLGAVCLERGHLAAAAAWCERALGSARRIGNRMFESFLRGNAALLRVLTGDPAGASADGVRVLDLAREVGTRRAEAHALHVLGAAARARGDDDEAVRRFREAVDVQRAAGYRIQSVWSLTALASLLTDLGDARAAASLLDEADAVCADSGLATGAAAVAVHRARIGAVAPAAAARLLDAQRDGLDVSDILDLRWRMWQAGGDARELAEARHLLDFLLDHAPPDRRAAMLSNVRLYREVAGATS